MVGLIRETHISSAQILFEWYRYLSSYCHFRSLLELVRFFHTRALFSVHGQLWSIVTRRIGLSSIYSSWVPSFIQDKCFKEQ